MVHLGKTFLTYNHAYILFVKSQFEPVSFLLRYNFMQWRSYTRACALVKPACARVKPACARVKPACARVKPTCAWVKY